jgi:cytochrome P450
MLGNHPKVQKKVQEEIDCVFGSEIDRDLSQEDVRAMPYLELVIKESLRICPPVPFIARKLGTDVALKDGRIIPKGTDVAICVPEIHRDQDNYPEPDKFLPERFLLENSTGRNPYSYLTFSAGPRNCLGQSNGI